MGAVARSQPTRALVLGESLIDVIVDGDRRTEVPGGSPMNVSIGLARQGIDVAFVTSLGADAQADSIELRLVSEGVDVYTPPRPCRTSTAIATLDSHGSASYHFDLAWTLAYSALPIGRPDVVHFGSLGSVLEPGAHHVDDLVEQFRGDALVSYDPNIRPRLDPDRHAARARVDRHAALSDIIKASVEDLAYIHPEFVSHPDRVSDGDAERMIDATITRWLSSGAALVVITRADLGVEMATPLHRLHIDSTHRVVADTIGAGDAFMAGLIAGIAALRMLGAAHRETLAAIDLAALRSIGTWAQHTAEISVTRMGAEPPTSIELLGALRGIAVA